MANMAHLHMHSSYSILDSVSKVSDIVKRLSEYGHTAAALTEHGNMASAPEFYRECKKYGIKAIPAEEFYMVPDVTTHKDDAKDGLVSKNSHHLILMAMDETGWKNLKLLNTEANKNFYYVPRIDYNMIKNHSDGLICLTACLKGIVPFNLANENFDEALKHATTLRNIFGDRFYLEVQDGGLDVQPKVNRAMRALGEHLGVPIVGCQDAHYIDRNDVEAHEAIWAIRTRDTLDKPIGYGQGKEFRPYYSTREYWLKDFEHILKEYVTNPKGEKRKTDIKQSELEMSAIIADRCKEIPIEFEMHLPRYEFIPEVSDGCATSCHDFHHHEKGETVDLTSFNYLVELVTNGYTERYGYEWQDAPQEHKERLKKELADIKDAGLADYFLIVWDVVRWAKDNDIEVGPSRGSAGGSMVSYCLKITGICPLKYGLIWERFFNRGRIGSLADIDLDFSMSRREEVINYIRNRFGEDRVSQMGTFNTMATKAVLKDTNRILGSKGMPFEAANVMTRFVPDKPKDLKDAVERSPQLKEYKEKYPKLFELAEKLEGCPKSVGKHAAGILISDRSFKEGSIPLRWDTKKKELVTEWDGDTLADLGNLKLDVLGITTLDVLQSVSKDVNRRLKNG